MSQRQHLTTRRGFIITMGFGGVALYGAWAAYGAAPLPIFQALGKDAEASPHQVEPAQGHGGHDAAKTMTPEEFLRRHEEFIARFSRPDGSVVLGRTEASLPVAHATPPASATDHNMHDTARRDAASSHQSQFPDHGVHGSAAIAPNAISPSDVYLLAYRFGFTPDDIHLEAGKPYRFRMMSSDIAHGASFQLGRGSRIIRLRANTMSEQLITFNRPGPVLVYCTVFCGAAHDSMKARILVA